METSTERRPARLVEGIVTLALGVIAAIVYFVSTAGYVYPGESAHLAAVWQGLDTAPFNQYPLMAIFAKLLPGNLIAPFCGVFAVMAFYRLLSEFVRNSVDDENVSVDASVTGRIAGVAGAVVFLFTPAVRGAATHLEPRLFDALWAMLALLVAGAYRTAPKSFAWLLPPAAGVMAGLGLADSPLFLLALPLFLAAFWTASKARGGKGFGAAAAFLIVFPLAFFVFAPAAVGDFAEFSRANTEALKFCFTAKNWIFVAVFATVPFVVSLFSARRAFNDQGGLAQWFFHVSMTVASVIAVATPFSPSSAMEPYGVLPVVTSAYAAFTAGYLVAYWWLQATGSVTSANESLDSNPLEAVGRYVAYVAGGVFAVAIAFTLLLNLFTFDGDAGAFADKVAERVLADLGERTWLVTDGTLDDHLRFAAARQGRQVNLVCLQRDLDSAYIKDLTALVKSTGVGGARNKELVLSTSLGVLPFVQDWVASDPDVAKTLAIFGAPDLWRSEKTSLQPVPELFFFGADPARLAEADAWREFDSVLAAPKGWGSYRLWETKDPVERMRLNLRRHLGLLANNRGVWLQDADRVDDAFTAYEAVLGEIDADNVCALFNEFELATSRRCERAVRKRRELEAKLTAIKDDKSRRYRLVALGNYYGYIRSAEIFVRLGFSFASSGRPGEALQHVRRAIDLVPTENRAALMNMMAALYASDNDQGKSREVYESVLAKDAENHDALIGLMRLELMNGDTDKAVEYLRRATEAAGDDPRARVEVAMLSMMTGDHDAARKMLRKVTDADHGNLQAWSMLAAVTMQQIDATTDAVKRNRLVRELKDDILATMEKQARGASDYYLLTTRAFVLMRDEEDRRQEARDALVAASRDRPDIGATSDIILNLDMQLNDTSDAERQAREALRRNRKDPLANYVMGSLALQRGDYEEAEAFLRRSADAPKPVVLALNDLAEVLRRGKRFEEAEAYARKAVEKGPGLYVAWETLGSIIMDAKGDLNEAEACVQKACELSKGKDGREEDVRMLISLARVQLARGDAVRGKVTIRKVQGRIGELSEFERTEFEELRKNSAR